MSLAALGCTGKNLRRELVHMVDWVEETGLDGEGFEYKGRHFHVEWFQSMDLSSFWKQAQLEAGSDKHLCFNSNSGYCPYCPCNRHDHAEHSKWVEWVLGTAMHYMAILPIGQENTIFCCMHGKIRIVEKLLTLAACSAKAAGPKVVAAFQAAVRSSGSGMPSFKVKVDADTAATTISSLYGFHCD